MEKIVCKLTETNVLTRWPCTVCGGETEKVPVLCEAPHPEGQIRVCEICLKSGDIDARLEARAEGLTKTAEAVRSLIGRLEVPAYSEWQRAIMEPELKERIAHYDNWGHGSPRETPIARSRLVALVVQEMQAALKSGDVVLMENALQLSDELGRAWNGQMLSGLSRGLEAGEDLPF